jgi:hypothetical protein
MNNFLIFEVLSSSLSWSIRRFLSSVSAAGGRTGRAAIKKKKKITNKQTKNILKEEYND